MSRLSSALSRRFPSLYARLFTRPATIYEMGYFDGARDMRLRLVPGQTQEDRLLNAALNTEHYLPAPGENPYAKRLPTQP